MSDLNELLAHIPVEQIAERLGVDRATADAAVRQALPALVAGMSANAKDPAGESSLTGALGQHDPSLLDGGVDLAQVDATDGEQIVGHIFGSKHAQVVDALGGLGGGSAGSSGGGSSPISAALMAKLLPLIAPIVMSYLAKQLGQKAASGSISGSPAGGGALVNILGSLLHQAGSSSGPTGGSAGGIDLGNILGGMLGAGRR